MSLLLRVACASPLIQKLTSSASIFEHSYFSEMNNDYLAFERLAYYQQMQFFTQVCPKQQSSSAIQWILVSDDILQEAYALQERQYLSNEKVIERASAIGTLEQLFGFLFNPPQNQQKKASTPIKSRQSSTVKKGNVYESVQKSINDFYHQNYEFREQFYTLNFHLKARPLIAMIFLFAFILVIYRLSKRSEQGKQRVLWCFSFLWVCTVIQLYFELNWLSLEPQPRSYSKILFLGIVPFEQPSSYLPEIMNLILFLLTLLYFFSLIIRFQDIFGHDDMIQDPQQIMESIIKSKKGSKSCIPVSSADPIINEESEDDFGWAGFTASPVIQFNPICVRTAQELYHFVVIHVILFLTFMKLMMLFEGLLFVKVNEEYSICTLDNLEIFPLTPRYLSIFTVSFLAFSEYIGKTPTDKSQHNFQRVCPYLIAGIHSVILIMSRRYLLTIDDLIIAFLFSVCMLLQVSSDQKKKSLSKKQDETNPSKMQQAEQLIRQQQAFQRQQQQVKPTVINPPQQYDTYSEDESSTESQFNDDQQILKNTPNTNKQLQEMLIRQLGEMSEEDTRKLFEEDLCNDDELIYKLQQLAQLKLKANNNPQMTQATQGGQGQQKQTAHKAPTKAPSGRPNPRKRR